MPGPAAHLQQPFFGGATAIFNAKMRGNHRRARVRHQRIQFSAQPQRDRQHAQCAAPKQRQRAVRRYGAKGFGVGIVIAEFFFFGHFFARDYGGCQKTLLLHARAQLGQQFCGLRKTFGQNVARAFKCGFGVGDIDRFDIASSRFYVQVFGGFDLRVERGVGKQCIGQRLQPGFARDLCFGAALGLIRQIQVFQHLLGGGGLHREFQRVGELALFGNRREYRGATVFQLTQIAEPLFQITQMRVVEIAGDLFAITRDKRHGCAFVEQCNGGGHLIGTNA